MSRSSSSNAANATSKSDCDDANAGWLARLRQFQEDCFEYWDYVTLEVVDSLTLLILLALFPPEMPQQSIPVKTTRWASAHSVTATELPPLVPRLQLVEVHGQPWFPSFLSDQVKDVLHRARITPAILAAPVPDRSTATRDDNARGHVVFGHILRRIMQAVDAEAEGEGQHSMEKDRDVNVIAFANTFNRLADDAARDVLKRTLETQQPSEANGGAFAIFEFQERSTRSMLNRILVISLTVLTFYLPILSPSFWTFSSVSGQNLEKKHDSTPSEDQAGNNSIEDAVFSIFCFPLVLLASLWDGAVVPPLGCRTAEEVEILVRMCGAPGTGGAEAHQTRRGNNEYCYDYDPDWHWEIRSGRELLPGPREHTAAAASGKMETMPPPRPGSALSSGSMVVNGFVDWIICTPRER